MYCGWLQVTINREPCVLFHQFSVLKIEFVNEIIGPSRKNLFTRLVRLPVAVRMRLRFFEEIALSRCCAQSSADIMVSSSISDFASAFPFALVRRYEY